MGEALNFLGKLLWVLFHPTTHSALFCTQIFFTFPSIPSIHIALLSADSTHIFPLLSHSFFFLTLCILSSIFHHPWGAFTLPYDENGGIGSRPKSFGDYSQLIYPALQDFNAPFQGSVTFCMTIYPSSKK